MTGRPGSLSVLLEHLSRDTAGTLVARCFIKHASGRARPLTDDCVLKVVAMVDHTHSPAFVIPSAKDIANRARGIFVDRGYADGFDRDDWLQAERELKNPPSAERVFTARSDETMTMNGLLGRAPRSVGQMLAHRAWPTSPVLAPPDRTARRSA